MWVHDWVGLKDNHWARRWVSLWVHLKGGKMVQRLVRKMVDRMAFQSVHSKAVPSVHQKDLQKECQMVHLTVVLWALHWVEMSAQKSVTQKVKRWAGLTVARSVDLSAVQ